MSAESRARYLERAAERAEREGNERLARILRRMAADLHPGRREEEGAARGLHPLPAPSSSS